jgi:hypothetical protein
MVSLGPPFGERRDESQVDWDYLTREYEIPRVVLQTDEIDNVWSIVRRTDGPQGHQDRGPSLEIEIKVEQLGGLEVESGTNAEAAHLDTPIFTIGDVSTRFPVRLRAGESLVCRDQKHWQRLNANGSEISSGMLPGSFPTLVPGANRIKLAFAKKRCSRFRVLVKTTKVY